MPTFFPRIPATFAICFSVPSVANRYWLVVVARAPPPAKPAEFHSAWTAEGGRPYTLLVFLPEGLDFHIHAGRQIELHQCIDRLLRGLEDVEQSLVRPDLEGLARFLVHVRRTQHAVFVLHRGQRNRARDLGAGAPSGFDDLTRGLVQDAVVVGFQPDANSFFSNHVSLSRPSRLNRKERTGGKLQAALL